MLDRKETCRQILGIGVDRVAKQKQLHDRQRDDEAQCYWIAHHLQPLLSQEGNEPIEGKCSHDSSSFTLSMWMNTSSRRGSASSQDRWPPPLDRSAVSSAARSVPAIRSACPNTAGASAPGAPRTRRAAVSKSPPVASKTTRPE